MEHRVGEAIHRSTFHDRWETRLHPRDRAGRWRDSVVADVQRLQVAHSKIRLRIASGEQGLETHDQVLARARQHAEDELRAQGLHLTPDGELVKIPGGEASPDRSSPDPLRPFTKAQRIATTGSAIANRLKDRAHTMSAAQLDQAIREVADHLHDAPTIAGETLRADHANGDRDWGKIVREAKKMLRLIGHGEASPDRLPKAQGVSYVPRSGSTAARPGSTMTSDTEAHKRILRQSRAARRTRELYPEGTPVRPAGNAAGPGEMRGTVERHVPASNAQGGILIVRWENGKVGRMTPISVTRDERPHGEASPDRSAGAPDVHAAAEKAAQAADEAFRAHMENPTPQSHRRATRLARIADAKGADSDRARAREPEASPDRAGKATYHAFGKLRTSETPYSHASQDSHGVVRFHTSRDAAARRGRVAEVTVATPEQIAAHRSDLAARAERERQREEEFRRQFSALPTTNDQAEQIARAERVLADRRAHLAQWEAQDPNSKLISTPPGGALATSRTTPEQLDAIGDRLHVGDASEREDPSAHLRPWMERAARSGISAEDAFAAFARRSERTHDELLPILAAVNARTLRDHEATRKLIADEIPVLEHRLAALRGQPDVQVETGHTRGFVAGDRFRTESGSTGTVKRVHMLGMEVRLDGAGWDHDFDRSQVEALTKLPPATPEASAATTSAAPEGRIPGAGAVVNGVAGRWAPVMGKQTHIPHHADWSAPGSDGSTLTSPAGTTKVFRNGALVSEPGKKALHRDVSRGATPAAPEPPAHVPYRDLPPSERGPTFDGSHAVFGTWRDPSGKEVSGVSTDDWLRLFPHDTGVMEGNPADVQAQLARLGYEWQPSSERPATKDETDFFALAPDPDLGGNSQAETGWITHDALAHAGHATPRDGALAGNPLGAYRDHQIADAATYNEQMAAALQANGEAERHYEDNVKAAAALRAEIAQRAAAGTSVRPRAEVDAEIARRDAAQATGGMPHRVATTHIDRGGAVTAFSENTRGRGYGLSTHLGTVQRVGRQWKHSRGDATFPTQDKAGSDLLRIAKEQGPPTRDANADVAPATVTADPVPTAEAAAPLSLEPEVTTERPERRVMVQRTLSPAHELAFRLRSEVRTAEWARMQRVEQLRADNTNVPPSVITNDAEYRRLDAAAQAAQLALASAEGVVGGRVFRIPREQRETLEKRITKLARSAGRVGVAPPTATKVGSEWREKRASAEIPEGQGERSFADYMVVKGEEPKIAGWSFMATLQHVNGVNVIRRMPGRDEAISLDDYRSGAAICDYCHLDRKRKDTYLIREDATGEIKQVGSNCIRDFLGQGDPAAIASFLETWSKLDDDFGGENEGGGGNVPMAIPTEAYLTHVALMIRTRGWNARSSGGAPTADAAYSNYLDWVRRRMERGTPTWVDPEPQDEAVAKAALKWVREDLAARAESAGSGYGLSEFDHNLVAMSKGDVVPPRGDGILAYVPVAHAKAMQREIERTRVARVGENSQHVGTVGERLKLRLKVERVNAHEGQYGVTYITKLADANGNIFKWFGSRELDQGKTYEGKFTVKSHGEYQGVKETQLARPSGLAEVDTQADDAVAPVARDAVLPEDTAPAHAAAPETAAQADAWERVGANRSTAPRYARDLNRTAPTADDPPVVPATDVAPDADVAARAEARREMARQAAAAAHERAQAGSLPEPTEPTAPGSLAGADLTRVHPKAIDSELGRIYLERGKYEARVASIQAVHDRDNARRARHGGQPHEMDARAVESMTNARAKMAELDAESAPMEAEFSRRGGWARYFIVTNGNGHVHSSTRCSTCFPTTEFAWLPDLAARSEHAMVQEYGEGACSVCFPSAPSMYQDLRASGQLSTRERATQAERDARQRLKAEREAAKAEKAIANPDGTPLRVWNHGVIRTLVTARNELVNTASNVAEAERARAALAADPNAPSTGYAHHYDEFVGDLERVVAAIAHKTGENPETIRAAAVEKAARRYQQRGY